VGRGLWVVGCGLRIADGSKREKRVGCFQQEGHQKLPKKSFERVCKYFLRRNCNHT
jgi:hypothetical protein